MKKRIRPTQQFIGLSIFLLSLVLASLVDTQAQSYKEWVRSGNRFYNQGDFASAVYSYQQAVDMKPEDEETQWSLAEAAREARDYKAASAAYGVVARLARGNKQRLALFRSAMMLKQSGDLQGWEEALRQFNDHVASLDEDILAHAAGESASIGKVKLMMEPDSVYWKVRNAGSVLNSDFAELRPWPLDDTILVFSSSQPLEQDDSDDIDAQVFRIFQARRTLRGFERPQLIDRRLNQDDMHTGNPAINVDGTKMYFTVCNRTKGRTGPCEIWVTERARGRWSRTRPLDDPVNIKGYTSTQPAPAMHGNQEVLYFVSDRPGGSGGLDIWYTILKKGVPTEPINAGAPLNTPGDEVTPYYDDVKKGLFFSSDRHPGLGGWDVFFSLGGMSKWEPPRNLGREVNSHAEDFGYIPPTPAYPGYLASNRPGSRTLGEETCCFDIYTADVMTTSKKDKEHIAEKVQQENQEIASRINTILPLSLYFDNDQPDPRSMSETTQSRYGSTLDEYINRIPEYLNRYSAGLPGLKSKQAADSISYFFDKEVLPARKQMQTLMQILLETLKEGRDVELVVRGYASPLNTPAYNKTLAARRIRSLINEMKEWNRGALLPYLEHSSPNNAVLAVSEIPVGVVEHGGKISADPTDLRNAIYSPEAARARRISILYGKVEGMVGKTVSGETSIRFKDKPSIPDVAENQHQLLIITLENIGAYPLNISSVEAIDPRIQTVTSGMVVGTGKTAEIFVKIDGPWDTVQDKLEFIIHGNLKDGKVVYHH